MVKRFDMCFDDSNNAEILEHSYGDYVLFVDYESLAYEYDMLKDKYDTLVKRLGELWQEG